MPLADCLIYALAAIGNLIFGAAVINRVHGVGLPRRAVKLLTLMAVLGVSGFPLAVLLAGWQTGWQIVDRETWLGIPEALLVYAAVCLAIVPAAAAVWAVHRWRDRHSGILLAERSQLNDLRQQALAGVRSPLMRGLIALRFNEASRLAVTQKTLALPRLPAALDGLSIAHLSDLHFIGRVGKQFFVEAIDRVNELDADIVALTGDILDHPRFFDWLPDTVERLRARHGVYFILGNHDVYVPTAELRRRLVAAGQIDLGSRTSELELRGVRIALAGNELPWIGPGPDVSRLPRDAALKIALVHGPDQFAWGRRHGFDLLLAGHHHGGQVRLPLLGAVACPSRYGTRYASGVFFSPPTVLHVSRGLSGEVPLRWNCPPEVSLLTLTAMGSAERSERVGERHALTCR